MAKKSLIDELRSLGLPKLGTNKCIPPLVDFDVFEFCKEALTSKLGPCFEKQLGVPFSIILLRNLFWAGFQTERSGDTFILYAPNGQLATAQDVKGFDGPWTKPAKA